MWKAFAELADLGWLNEAARPRMVSVQAMDCAPIVRAFEAGAERAEAFANASTHAAGLRVPAPFADRAILRAIRESQGTAVAVSEEAIRKAQAGMARAEGLFAAPEAAAAVAGLARLVDSGWLDHDARVVVFDTGTGLKYISD
jgi:threonine synthase